MRWENDDSGKIQRIKIGTGVVHYLGTCPKAFISSYTTANIINKHLLYIGVYLLYITEAREYHIHIWSNDIPFIISGNVIVL